MEDERRENTQPARFSKHDHQQQRDYSKREYERRFHSSLSAQYVNARPNMKYQMPENNQGSVAREKRHVERHSGVSTLFFVFAWVVALMSFIDLAIIPLLEVLRIIDEVDMLFGDLSTPGFYFSVFLGAQTLSALFYRLEGIHHELKKISRKLGA